MLYNICLCDDDADDRELFQRALNIINDDLTVSNFTDGDELVLQLYDPINNLPQIIFLDINMRRKNGLDTLAEIKTHTHLMNIPLVIFTTSSNPANIAAAYSLGAYRYLIKPASFSLLKDQIKKIITIPLQFVSNENFLVS